MIAKRLNSLRKSFVSEKIDGIIVSSPINIHYLTGFSNFSREEREAYLFVTEKTATLFTDPRYIEAVERTIHSEIKATIKPTIKTVNQAVKFQKVAKIGFENNLTFAEYAKFKKEIKAKFSLTDGLVGEIREIKDDEEIKALKRAAKLTDQAFEYITPFIKTGVTEQEIAFKLEMFVKKLGGTLAFDSIVAFGTNSSIPHHLTSDKKLSNGDEFAKLDFGAKIGGYCCDMTRTILFKHSSDRAKKIYSTVLDAQKAAIKYINETKNPSGKTAFEKADFVITKSEFSSIPHGLGHGVGLEIHEKPTLSKKSNDILADGMVFTIEPGVYIPGFGGVRIEDTVLFKNGKVELLTKSAKEMILN